MKIFNKACIAAAFGMILLVTFGCEDSQIERRKKELYNDCMDKTSSTFTPWQRDLMCKEHARNNLFGWSK